MNYDETQLETIADKARTNLAETWSLFAIPGEPPVISAGIVKCVIDALPSAPPKPQSDPPRPEPVDDKAAILAFLRNIAVDGVLPTATAYNAQRPKHLPAANLVKRLFGTGAWKDLAAHAGLQEPVMQVIADAKRARRTLGQSNQHTDADVSDEQVLTCLRGLSEDGTLPSAAVYDGGRPRHYPSSGTVLSRFGCRWTELAERAGLELSERQRKQSKARLEKLREEEAAAADDARFHHRGQDQPVSDEARATLGPEHVVVNGYRN